MKNRGVYKKNCVVFSDPLRHTNVEILIRVEDIMTLIFSMTFILIMTFIRIPVG